jgi:ketosteroid isomerase-like protein
MVAETWWGKKVSYGFESEAKRTIRHRDKADVVWKRQKDGSWKLSMDMGVPQE